MKQFPGATERGAVTFKYNQIEFGNTNGDFIDESLLQQLRKSCLIFLGALLNCA